MIIAFIYWWKINRSKKQKIKRRKKGERREKEEQNTSSGRQPTIKKIWPVEQSRERLLSQSFLCFYCEKPGYIVARCPNKGTNDFVCTNSPAVIDQLGQITLFFDIVYATLGQKTDISSGVNQNTRNHEWQDANGDPA